MIFHHPEEKYGGRNIRDRMWLQAPLLQKMQIAGMITHLPKSANLKSAYFTSRISTKINLMTLGSLGWRCWHHPRIHHKYLHTYQEGLYAFPYQKATGSSSGLLSYSVSKLSHSQMSCSLWDQCVPAPLESFLNDIWDVNYQEMLAKELWALLKHAFTIR